MSVDKSKLTNRKLRVYELLQKLRQKLVSFTVVNLQGQVLGRIEDFSVDKNSHLNMIISRSEVRAASSRFALSSKYIEKVDTLNRLLVVDFTQEKLKDLPEYQLARARVTEVGDYLPKPSVVNTGAINSSEIGERNSSQTQVTELRGIGEPEGFEETSEEMEQEIIRLLEERLFVSRSKQKVGEVVVRKEIETRMVEVPVRREKLIIEQVGAETKQLAEIDLGKGEVKGIEHHSVSSGDMGYTVKGEFVSPRAVSDLLDAIALQKRHGCSKIRVKLIVDSQELQETYQKMFDRCSQR